MISQVTARSGDCETFRVLPLIQKDDSYTERLRHCYRVGHIIIIGLTRTDLARMPDLPRVDEVVRSVNCMQLCCCPCCSFANLVTVTVVVLRPLLGDRGRITKQSDFPGGCLQADWNKDVLSRRRKVLATDSQ